MNTSFAHAQNEPWRWNIGVTGGEASSKTFGSRLGVDIGLEKKLAGPISATMGVGFTHLFEKSIYGLVDYSAPYGESYNAFPVKAGLKLSVSKSIYLGADAGVALSSKRYGNSFIWSPSVGFALDNGLNFSLHYENIERIRGAQTIGLRIGYGLPFNKKSSSDGKQEIQSWQMGVGFSTGAAWSGGLMLGGEIFAYKLLNEYLEAVLTTGFSHTEKQLSFSWDAKAGRYYNRGIDLIPLKGGLRFYPGNSFYLSGDAGAAISTNSIIKSGFNYTPGMGLRFHNGLDLGIKFDFYTSQAIPNTVAAKIGYRFKL